MILTTLKFLKGRQLFNNKKDADISEWNKDLWPVWETVKTVVLAKPL
jgi:hypothetical protein|tara:strand:+ start:358 stop:498 length:141 start_codon:yes stop_codon:yes gene_type:complete